VVGPLCTCSIIPENCASELAIPTASFRKIAKLELCCGHLPKGTVLGFLEKYWAIVAATPLPFVMLAIIVATSVWGIATVYFSGQIATAKGQVELAEKQRDDFKSKLAVSNPDEAKSKVDHLEGELAGLNRVIAVTVGYDWKPLTEAQIEYLSKQLASLPKHRVQIMYLNQLGRKLAGSFYQAFQMAGWDGATLMDGGGAPLGIIAGPGAGKAAHLKQAIEASTSYQVDLDKPTQSDFGDSVYLFVGINQHGT
jgi:hypothetical protein